MEKELFRTEEAYGILAERREILNKILDNKKKSTQKVPEGSVRIVKCGKSGYNCFLRKSGKDKSGEYIKKSEQKIAYQLAQKEYDLKLIKNLELEARAIDELFRATRNCNYDMSVMLSPTKADFVKPLIYSDEKYVKQWLSTPYEKFEAYEKNTEFVTKNNEIVRSKSEILIANALYDREIPYRYELPLQIGNTTIHPDFNVLNVRNRKEYIWEHFGMMDNQEYANRAIKKISMYQNNNYFDGENAIFTFETAETPLSTRIIDRIIDKCFK